MRGSELRGYVSLKFKGADRGDGFVGFSLCDAPVTASQASRSSFRGSRCARPGMTNERGFTLVMRGLDPHIHLASVATFRSSHQSRDRAPAGGDASVRKADLDNIPTRIIVRIVLSVRGASRGVVERDRSPAGRPAGEGLAKLHGAAASSLTRRPARGGSHPRRPGGKRSPSAATMSGCPSRGWTGRNEAGEIPVLPAPGRTVQMPKDRRWWARRDGVARWFASHRDQPPTLRQAARPRPSS